MTIKFFSAVLIILIFAYGNSQALAEEQTLLQEQAVDETQFPVKKSYATEYWLFGSVPVIIIGWGIGAWGWGTASKWHFENDGWGLEQDSYTGGADKLGHTWGIYLISRVGSYAFEKSGDATNWAAFKGFLFGQLMGLGIEIGDGFGDTYGFAWGDMVWNLGGGIIAMALDMYPPLDRLIGFQMEYWPSKDHRNQRPEKWLEFTSDVTGQKFLLALKMSGIPYIQDTPAKFFQIDFGYYTRGYWFSDSSYRYKTRHAYIGFAFNLSIVSESVIPEGSWRRGFSTFFKYYHPPVAYNPDALDHTFAGSTPSEQD
ncbi:MAG: DUF2279 domain-containing protein [Spirochaetes bacterium]|nr:DUF2279 domain-containing protein [Spirochaetota bacterium]